MSGTANIHATCVAVAAKGVLLLGPSGAGKSDLALRLIGRGAVLVADDRCDLSVSRGALVAAVPKTIAGLLEVRGVGLVKYSHVSRVEVALVADLAAPVERLPAPTAYVPPPAVGLRQSARPPLIALNPFETSAVDKVLAALRHLARRRGRVVPP
jgi:HPr kinase/phosphorylase